MSNNYDLSNLDNLTDNWNITSIINALESKTNPVELFSDSLPETVNNLTQWFDRNLLPSLQLITDKQTRLECVKQLSILTSKFNSISNDLMRYNKPDNRKSYKLICDECNNSFNGDDFLTKIEQHEHVIEILNSGILKPKQQQHNSVLNHEFVPDLKYELFCNECNACFYGGDLLTEIEQHEHAIEILNYGILKPKLNINQFVPLMHRYDMYVQMKLYPRQMMSKLTHFERTGFLYTVRKNHSDDYVCLLCNIKLLEQNVNDHVVSFDHFTGLMDKPTVSMLEDYHKFFIELNPEEQKLQIYFTPYDNKSVWCVICKCPVVKTEFGTHFESSEHILRLENSNFNSFQQLDEETNENLNPFEHLDEINDTNVLCNGSALEEVTEMETETPINYNSEILSAIYPEEMFKLLGFNETERKQFFVQQIKPKRYRCLLCNANSLEFDSYLKHKKGMKHTLYSSNPFFIRIVQNYHSIMSELSKQLQMHQVFFVPDYTGRKRVKCLVCRIYVTSTDFEEHVSSTVHCNELRNEKHEYFRYYYFYTRIVKSLPNNAMRSNVESTIKSQLILNIVYPESIQDFDLIIQQYDHNRFRCLTCGIELKDCREHVMNRKHVRRRSRRADRVRMFHRLFSELPIHERVHQIFFKLPPPREEVYMKCTACRISLTSANELKAHVSDSEHLRSIEKESNYEFYEEIKTLLLNKEDLTLDDSKPFDPFVSLADEFVINESLIYNEVEIAEKLYPKFLTEQRFCMDANKRMFLVQKISEYKYRCLLCQAIYSNKFLFITHTLDRIHQTKLKNWSYFENVKRYHSVFLTAPMWVQMNQHFFSLYCGQWKCDACHVILKKSKIGRHVANPKHRYMISTGPLRDYYFANTAICPDYEIFANHDPNEIEAELNGSVSEGISNSSCSIIPEHAIATTTSEQLIRIDDLKNVFNQFKIRLRAHYDFFDKFDDFFVCTICLVALERLPEHVFAHVISDSHTKNAIRFANYPKYEYYCNVCSMRFKNEFLWNRHLEGNPTLEPRCQKKKDVSEYECVGCKIIIFGKYTGCPEHSSYLKKSVANVNEMEDDSLQLQKSDGIKSATMKLISSKNVKTVIKPTIYYDYRIRTKLYPKNVLNPNECMITVDGNELYLIQNIEPDKYVCLICDSVVFNNETELRVHIGEKKHRNELENGLKLEQLVYYHWTFQTQAYALQMHQHFFKLNRDAKTVKCKVCDSIMAKESLQSHLKGKNHWKQIRSISQYERYYFVDEIETVLKMESNSNESVKKSAVHEIIEPLQKDSLWEFDSFPNRFEVHRQFFKFDNNIYTCTKCEKNVKNNLLAIQQHIADNVHVQHVSPFVNVFKYLYYCDICCKRFNTETKWISHATSEAHLQRMKVLKSNNSKHTSCMEYECNTCKIIFFGNESCIKKHLSGFLKGVKKSDEFIMWQEIRNVLKNESAFNVEMKKLLKQSDAVLNSHDRTLKCCEAIAQALSDEHVKCCTYAFGSRVSGLGSLLSDLDVFVDINGKMFMGNEQQDAKSQADYVHRVAKLLKKKPEFSHINKIPDARTPIVQVYHSVTRLDCDLSFRNGLSVQNTDFVRLCIDVEPKLKNLILFLKRWLSLSKIKSKITTYMLTIISIYFMQVHKFLPTVHQLRELGTKPVLVIQGWSTFHYDKPISELRNHLEPCDLTIRELLRDFFEFYMKFNFEQYVICPLLGYPILKNAFSSALYLPHEMSSYVKKVKDLQAHEVFRSRTAMCVQDPFDLCHNLTKSCTQITARQFVEYCRLSYEMLSQK